MLALSISSFCLAENVSSLLQLFGIGANWLVMFTSVLLILASLRFPVLQELGSSLETEQVLAKGDRLQGLCWTILLEGGGAMFGSVQAQICIMMLSGIFAVWVAISTSSTTVRPLTKRPGPLGWPKTCKRVSCSCEQALHALACVMCNASAMQSIMPDQQHGKGWVLITLL